MGFPQIQPGNAAKNKGMQSDMTEICLVSFSRSQKPAVNPGPPLNRCLVTEI